MTTEPARRRVVRDLHVSAPPERVFPLLCPVRERDWVPGWAADVLRSESGMAEDNCVFAASGAVWIVTRHEPFSRIEFAIVDADVAQTLRIFLTPSNGGTEMSWTRVYTGLSPAGNAWIEANVPDAAFAKLGHLEAVLARYLAS